MELGVKLQSIKEIILSSENAKFCSIIGLLLLNVYLNFNGDVNPELVKRFLIFTNNSTL